MDRSVRRYVILVCIASGLMFGTLVFAAPYESHVVVASSILFLIGLGLLGEWLVYTLPDGAVGSIAFIPFLAAASLSPSWVTAAGVAGAVLVSQAARRMSPIKLFFNVGEHLLTFSVAILVFKVAGGRSLFDLQAASLLDVVRLSALPISLLILSFFLVNSILVSGVLARTQNQTTWNVWRQGSLSLAAYDVIASPIILLLAWLVVQWGAVGAFLLALPVLGIRQLYKTNLQLRQVNQDLLELMVKAIEARDPYTSGHSRRVEQYAVTIARILGMSERDVERVRTAALLHDVGKIYEDFAPILSKPDRLTPAEWAIMKTHSIKSAELVATATHLRELVPAVRHHHENWDGSGYPDGLKGSAIPLESRVIMLADTIDAMTSERPYRGALSEAEVRAEFARCRGSQFDPEMADRLLVSSAFSQLFAPEKRTLTPPGSLPSHRASAGHGARLAATG
jgi:putative nucleotidyltransferase with HDIG domain